MLLTESGEVKLADFGVSTELIHTMSRRNSFIGTLYWMAPEAIQEKEYDERADLWSLGITLIEIAESAPPHKDVHYARALFVIPKDPSPTLQKKDAWTPLMHRFLSRLLVKDPQLRPSATTMLSDPFVAPERCATSEEMRNVIAEVREKLDAMPTARRLGDVSTCSSDTIVERPSEHDTGSPREHPGSIDGRQPFSVPSAFDEGALVNLPLLSLDDLSFDELCPLSALSPLGQLVDPKVLLASESEDENVTLPPMLYATRTLLCAFYYNKEHVYTNGVTPEGDAEARRKTVKYGSVLKSILRL